MPVFAFFFGLVTMSSIGLPVLNGFVGEFLILLGAFLAQPLVRGGRDQRRGPGRRLHALDVPARVLRAGRQRGEPQADRPRPAREAGAGRDGRSRSSGSASTPSRCCAAIEPRGDRRCSRTCSARADARAGSARAGRRSRSRAGEERRDEPARAQPLGASARSSPSATGAMLVLLGEVLLSRTQTFLGRRLTRVATSAALLALHLDALARRCATYMAADVARSGTALPFDLANPMFRSTRSRRSITRADRARGAALVRALDALPRRAAHQPRRVLRAVLFVGRRA